MEYFKIGLILLLCARLVEHVRRRIRRRGAPITEGGETICAKTIRGKEKIVRAVRFSLDVPDRFHFSLRRETKLDRLAKRCGIAREWQTGDEKFDFTTFIVSEDWALLETMSADAELRALMATLLQFEGGGTLECANGLLWFTVWPLGEHRDVSDALVSARFVRQLRPSLTRLRDRLSRIAVGDWQADRDPGLRRRSVLVGVSAFLGAAGIVGYFVNASYLRLQVVREAISFFSVCTTAAIAGTMLLAVLLWLRRTPHTHAVLLDILCIALPGAWFGSNGAFSWYNEEFDTGTPVRLPVSVESVYAIKRDKSLTYHLVVARWPNDRGARDVIVPQREFALATPGECVFAMWHQGRLGDNWVSGYEHAFAEDCDREKVE